MEPIKTEPIKQEIINNIFENGDKLITGPILQTVLIDMIDDVNVKDQEILSKTGSWDNAVTQIPNLATKTELTEAKDGLQGNITNLSESVARDLANVDLTGYATETWVESQGYLKEHQDISGLATKAELTQAENNLQGNITSLSESVARDLANVPEGVATEAWVQNQDYASKTYVNDAVASSSVDLTGYATETWVQNQGYLKEHQDISGLATKSELTSVSESVQTDISNLATKGELNEAKNNLQGNITSLSESVARDIANVDVDLTGYATETWVQSQGYLTEHQNISGLATKVEVTNLSESVARDLTGYATETWVQSQGYLKEHQDISGLATKTELTTAENNLQGNITSLSESVANSAVWKKGTGKDSAVQKLTGNNEAFTSTASGLAAVAIGFGTTASGQASYAEGARTIASGDYSHVEGYGIVASNLFEHAQGMLNHSSENQIFSVGAGDGDASNPSTVTRRNAISVLAVRNNNSYTSSFFVQNIGGYDGTNPTPGTNDLATVINGLSSSGGSSETLWKKGTGKDSAVLILTGNDEANTPTASGLAAVAIGTATKASGPNSHAEGGDTEASGYCSHAEGQFTTASAHCSHAEGHKAEASGNWSHAEGNGTRTLEQCSHAEGNTTLTLGSYSHAEGNYTTASGDNSHAEGDGTEASGSFSHAEGAYTKASGNWSHAEGFNTITSNQYEHAQGRYNHNSENQVFSIGTGNNPSDRRNAVSVLEVDNNGSYTSSFFVQNIGGYDGTNPTPGTNDLATVLNNTETWTFTLDTGTTVTKNVRIS